MDILPQCQTNQPYNCIWNSIFLKSLSTESILKMCLEYSDLVYLVAPHPHYDAEGDYITAVPVMDMQLLFNVCIV